MWQDSESCQIETKDLYIYIYTHTHIFFGGGEAPHGLWDLSSLTRD